MADPLGTIRTTAGRGAMKVREDTDARPGWLSWTYDLRFEPDLLTDEIVQGWLVRSGERCGDRRIGDLSEDLPGCSRPRTHTVTDTYDPLVTGHSMYPLPGDYLDYLP